MNKYESIIIVNPKLNEKQQNEIENKYKKIINKNGNVISIENIGKKRLAYEVKKNKEGIYIEINFTSEASFIAELERQYKIDENVIKFIVIRKED
ncbi:MAG: 30S ribosomal protein S6 [Clostridia bacterium]|jgi:small subunit ribosomal protein S6|nr:MAG TPA: 30S ribosomal protein S6 [Caudoviricetes sp.]